MLVKFFSFNDLENSKKLYETNNFSNLTMCDAKTLEAMNVIFPHYNYGAYMVAKV